MKNKKNNNILNVLLNIFEVLPNTKIVAAKNQNMYPEILEWLAASSTSSDIRYEVARNPKTPFRILTELTNDVDVKVRRGVAENENCTSYLLNVLIEEKDDVDTALVVINHPNVSLGILSELANRKNPKLSQAIFELIMNKIRKTQYPNSLFPE